MFDNKEFINIIDFLSVVKGKNYITIESIKEEYKLHYIQNDDKIAKISDLISILEQNDMINLDIIFKEAFNYIKKINEILKIKNNVNVIKNKHSNLEHFKTNVVFDEDSGRARGIQLEDGKIGKMKLKHILICECNGWFFNRNSTNIDCSEYKFCI